MVLRSPEEGLPAASQRPAAVADAATCPEPARYPVGIETVLVNGTPAVVDGEETGLRSGRLLRST